MVEVDQPRAGDDEDRAEAVLSDKAPPPDNPDAGGVMIPKVVPPLPRWSCS